jgi:hypothetical protein
MKATDRVTVQSVRGTGYALALASTRMAVEEGEPHAAHGQTDRFAPDRD